MKEKVLIIEDEPKMRKNLVNILQLEGFDSIGAEDGRIGFEMCQLHRPNLILCDITLPGLDGFQVLKQVRSDSNIGLTPFIFLTAKGEKSDQRLGMTLGADDYLSKPFTPDDLMRAVRSQLSKHHAWNIETKHKLDYKSHFVASVTHDLRSPLAVLLLNLDSLQFDHTTLSEKSRLGLMEEMRCQITLMNRMIEDILTFGRLEAGTLPVHRLPVDVVDLVRHVIREVNIIDGGEHKFELSEGKLAGDICLDPLLTRQIVSNLLTNASKYSGPGTTIRIALHSEGDCLVLKVIDQGVGISATEIERIFHPFQRGDNVGKQLGMGYGLFIVKSYVEWLGGTIAVESAPRQGSTFTVRLPAKESPGATVAHSSSRMIARPIH